MTGSAMGATAAAEVDVLLNVNTSPGARSAAVGHVADSLTSSAGQSLRAPVAGCYLGSGAALVPVAITMRWGGMARLSGLIAALIIIVPVSAIALGIVTAVFVLRNAAIEVVVPFPIARATFVMRRRRGVVRATSREAAVTSSIAIVAELGLGALFGGDCEGEERNKSDRQELHS